jgi:hypothetical protein
LRSRYQVQFELHMTAATSLNNYEYLDILDRAWCLSGLPRPEGGELCDVGCASFWYAATLHAFFRPRRLLGVDVEGFRLAWRLPLSLLQPERLFRQIHHNLRPDGLFVMINHGIEEAAVAAELCIAARLRPIWRGFQSSLAPHSSGATGRFRLSSPVGRAPALSINSY